MIRKWYDDPLLDAGVVITSRVRLARNIKKYPFAPKLSFDGARGVVDDVYGAVERGGNGFFSGYARRDFRGMPGYEKQTLVNRHIVSPGFFNGRLPQGLALSPDEKVSIMVNEEDHIRLQAIAPGGDMADAWERINRADDALESTIDYAYDETFGYLTSCPTNTGTGLRASYMVHIPLLEITGELRGIVPAISKFGMTLRGMYGEGSEPMGGIYQISNQVSIGKSEEDIISSLNALTKRVTDSEEILREKMSVKDSIETKDRVYRALGVLRSCRKISVREAMEHLSVARFGYISGVLAEARPPVSIYSIIINAQNGSLQFARGEALGEAETDIARADYLREEFKNIG